MLSNSNKPDANGDAAAEAPLAVRRLQMMQVRRSRCGGTAVKPSIVDKIWHLSKVTLENGDAQFRADGGRA